MSIREVILIKRSGKKSPKVKLFIIMFSVTKFSFNYCQKDDLLILKMTPR